jgi:beta-glucanase (GH16 family)
LHYWQTNNLEWYDPTHVTTKNGKLVLTLDNTHTNGMNYTGASEYSFCSRFCSSSMYGRCEVGALDGESDRKIRTC